MEMLKEEMIRQVMGPIPQRTLGKFVSPMQAKYP